MQMQYQIRCILNVSNDIVHALFPTEVSPSDITKRYYQKITSPWLSTNGKFKTNRDSLYVSLSTDNSICLNPEEKQLYNIELFNS